MFVFLKHPHVHENLSSTATNMNNGTSYILFTFMGIEVWDFAFPAKLVEYIPCDHSTFTAHLIHVPL